MKKIIVLALMLWSSVSFAFDATFRIGAIPTETSFYGVYCDNKEAFAESIREVNRKHGIRDVDYVINMCGEIYTVATVDDLPTHSVPSKGCIGPNVKESYFIKYRGE